MRMRAWQCACRVLWISVGRPGSMVLTVTERKAATKKLALEYRRGDKTRKGQILDQIYELNSWHRSHARKK